MRTSRNFIRLIELNQTDEGLTHSIYPFALLFLFDFSIRRSGTLIIVITPKVDVIGLTETLYKFASAILQVKKNSFPVIERD